MVEWDALVPVFLRYKRFYRGNRDSTCFFQMKILRKASAKSVVLWRGARVVESGGLENRYTEKYLGFESLPLR